MRLLVTGGAGFIGANFVHAACASTPSIAVTVLDALTYAGSRESLAPVEDQMRLVQGDITDAELVAKLVAEADAVVHFAAETHVDNALADPEPFLRTNVVGTFTDAGGGAPRTACGCTTCRPTRCTATSNSASPQRFTESTPYNPSSPYSSTKAAGRPAGARVGAVLRCARRRSRTAPTTTGPISMWRSSFRARSPTC